jgi:hypothetical protein
MIAKFQIKPKDACPCGSGIEYRKCHTPYRDKSDDNLWKGPGHPQVVYLAHKKQLNGFVFEKNRKGEFVHLSNEDRVPVARYFCIDESVLSCKSVVRLLSLTLKDNRITYSGSLEIKGNPSGTIPIIIGCIDVDSIETFDADQSGRPVTSERGNWVVFIGENDNPIARIKDVPQWFRFLRASGYLVEFEPPGEINFRLSVPAQGFNLFSLALPFNEIELPHPRLSIGASPFVSEIEIENENISWDLVLHQEAFSEKQKVRQDSKIFPGRMENGQVRYDAFDIATRKYFAKPVKTRIGLFLPEQSPIIGKFSATLECTIRSISEDRGFDFSRGENDKSVLEADFRDHILTILKSMEYFACAEPARKGGFIDILIKKGESEAIIEFKVWGRRKYKQVIGQVLDYGTAWTTEFATVIINPNIESITDKFITNARTSPGFRTIDIFSQRPSPLEKLVSSHHIWKWGKDVAVTHYIINTRQLQ